AESTGATVVDPATVQVNYSTPVNDGILASLALVPILPKHVWAAKLGDKGQGLLKFDNLNSVYGGPFGMNSFSAPNTATFTANPNWYGPKPKIQHWGIQYFGSSDAMTEALATNQIDLITALAPTAVSALQGKPNITVQEAPGVQVDHIDVNIQSKAHPELQ